MKNIIEILNPRNQDKPEEIDRKTRKSLVDYAKFYGYDANELIASIIWLIYTDCCISNEPEYSGLNTQNVEKNWKKEYIKAYNIINKQK